MRCPNYRIFCPNGLHLSHEEVCERCLGGKEFWCILQNCENDIIKSTGYAIRNATARISRRILDRISMFIVLSEFQKKRFIAEGIPQELINIIPNIAPSALNDSSANTGDRVSFVGRISPEKGITDFLAAAARLPNIPFSVAGDHSHMTELVEKSPSNVRWMGFLKNDDLNKFYYQSRLLVFPGKCFEGFPNVITHAMAFGKPVIASCLGGVPEIVEHQKTGLLFKPGDVSELTAAIQRLYTDPILYNHLGESGRKKAETIYNPKMVYSAWKKSLDQVLLSVEPSHS